MAGTQHYSLRWNNHQSHVLNAFDSLLQNEALVDCTLVCEDTSIRAHKVVLSACRYDNLDFMIEKLVCIYSFSVFLNSLIEALFDIKTLEKH